MGKSLEEKIIRMYNEENKSTYEIAEVLETYPNKIRRTLKKHGYSLKSKSDAQKLALESGRVEHPTRGKNRTLKERIKISSGLSSHWDSISDEERENRSKQAKERWEKMDASQKAKMSDLAMSAIRKAGKEGSKLEKFLLGKLNQNGYTVEVHNKNLIPTEKLEIDLYIPKLKTIIEVDGPSHFLPIWGEDKLQKQIKADLHKSGLILSRGFAIIRVKAMTTPSLKQKEELSHNVVGLLKGIEKKFPEKTERFIEVDL